MYRTAVSICTAQRSLYVGHSGHYMYRTAVSICTAQRSLYVPHSGHYMYRTVVTTCTTSLTFTILRSAHTAVFMCFVWISEQTAIISTEWFLQPKQMFAYCAVRAQSLNTIHVNFVCNGKHVILIHQNHFTNKTKHKTTLHNRSCAPHSSFCLQTFEPPGAITDLQQSPNYWVYCYTKYINFRLFRLFCASVTATTSRVYMCACVHSKCRANRVA